MGTIAENLLALQQAKTDIKTAIESKGQNLSGVPFTEYAGKIESIQSGGGTGGEYFVKVIDYDGTILAEANLNTGDTFELPNAPSHDGLVFQEWSCSQDIVDNVITIEDNNVMVGAVYTTASGMSEFDIELTKATGLAVTLNMDGRKDWGDGTIDTTKKHTYSDYGSYTIKCNGTMMTMASNSGLFGQKSGAVNYYCVNVRFAKISHIATYALSRCSSLKSITIPNSVETIQTYAFYLCYLLKSLIIPNGVEIIQGYMLKGCHALTDITIPNSVKDIQLQSFQDCDSLTDITIPNSVISLGNQTFYECSSLSKIIIPNSVTSIGNSLFYSCSSLTKAIISNSVASIGEKTFYECKLLQDIIIPNNITSIGNDAFNYCESLINIIIPNNVTTIGERIFQYCIKLNSILIQSEITSIGNGFAGYCRSLTNITIPNTVLNIGSASFYSCNSIKIYDFSGHTVVPTLSNTSAFYDINALAKIIVPDELYDEWIVATNWSTYADYIYKASEVL